MVDVNLNININYLKTPLEHKTFQDYNKRLKHMLYIRNSFQIQWYRGTSKVIRQKKVQHTTANHKSLTLGTVVHTCNSGYLGGEDLSIYGLKPA
jgi:hypothetical protein